MGSLIRVTSEVSKRNRGELVTANHERRDDHVRRHLKGEVMSNAISAADVRPLRTGDGGMVIQGVDAGANVVQGAVTGTFGVAKAIRGEAFRLTNGLIDWAESVPASGFKIVRELVTRLDDVTRATVDGAESVSLAVTGLLRVSGEAAAEMISRTTATVAGKKDTPHHAA
jgi:hypothetical protein